MKTQVFVTVAVALEDNGEPYTIKEAFEHARRDLADVLPEWMTIESMEWDEEYDYKEEREV